MIDIDDDKNKQKPLEIRLLYFLFTIPHKVVFKDFVYFIGTANLRNKYLLIETIFITCTISCQSFQILLQI